MEYVTALYPNDPERAIEIVWRDGENKTIPESITIRGCKSRWKTVHGISLGISLKQLEELDNGRPFALAGFGWDYSGQITSWENGSLAADLDGGYGQIRILLDSPERHDVSEKELQDVSGDRSFIASSNDAKAESNRLQNHLGVPFMGAAVMLLNFCLDSNYSA